MSKLKKVQNWSLVMLSGGIDSTALALKLISEGKTISGVFLDQGQLSNLRQETAIRKLAIDYHFPLYASRLSSTLDIYLPVIDMPYNRQTERQESCKVITICSSLAAMYGATDIYYGATIEDKRIIPGMTEMLTHIEAMIRLNSGRKDFHVIAPFLEESRQFTLKILSDFAPDVMTWSCLWGGQYHCGECEGCQNRITRFKKAGIPDQTIYSKKASAA